MTAVTGKAARIAVTAATPTSSTDNAADLAAGGLLLSITSTGKRHWPNGTTSLKIFEGASTKNMEIETINYVSGIVTMSTPHSTATTWTIDVESLTASFVGMGKAWTVNQNTDLRDHTSFSTGATNTSWRTIKPGLATWTASIDRFSVEDPAGSTEQPAAAFFDRLNVGTETVIELWTEHGTQNKLEGFAYVGGDGFTVPVDGDADEAIELTGNGQLYLSTA